MFFQSLQHCILISMLRLRRPFRTRVHDFRLAHRSKCLLLTELRVRVVLLLLPLSILVLWQLQQQLLPLLLLLFQLVLLLWLHHLHCRCGIRCDRGATNSCWRMGFRLPLLSLLLVHPLILVLLARRLFIRSTTAFPQELEGAREETVAIQPRSPRDLDDSAAPILGAAPLHGGLADQFLARDIRAGVRACSVPDGVVPHSPPAHCRPGLLPGGRRHPKAMRT
mmetsp:Transcript_55614/g.140736  ORF Transcript_55614/g.140736 Transcript_55614/m.140736 type:complete len:223 (-) Transcript_55614:153-821(-)